MNFFRCVHAQEESDFDCRTTDQNIATRTARQKHISHNQLLQKRRPLQYKLPVFSLTYLSAARELKTLLLRETRRESFPTFACYIQTSPVSLQTGLQYAYPTPKSTHPPGR